MLFRKRAWVVGVAVVSACAGVVRAAPVGSTSSDGFVDYMGINIHSTHYLGRPGEVYDDNNWPGIINIVSDLGFRNVRDHGIAVEKLNQLTDATGAKLMAITEWQDGATGPLLLNFNMFNTRMEQTKQLHNLGWIEGPNEYDGFGDPNWNANLLQWQTQLYNYVKNDPVLKKIPVLAPTVYGDPSVEPLRPYNDFGNIHQYPTGRWPLSYHEHAITHAAYAAGTKPIIASESGYNNAMEDLSSDYPVTELASYKYIPRLFMDYYQAGHPYLFLYELADEGVDPNGANGLGSQEYHFGLVRHDLSYKPQAHAVKNLIAQLSDLGEEFTPGSLDYTITGGNSELRQVLLQKRDGSYVLALWEDVLVYDNTARTDIINPALGVTLSVNAPVSLVEEFKLDSMIPTDLTAGLSTFGVDVLDEVKLLHITLDPAVQKQWTKSGDGTWQTGSNWSGGSPVGMFNAAHFGTAGASAHAVTVSSPVTVSALSFDSAASYTLSGQQITLDTPMFSSIDVNAGAHTIAAPLKLNRDTAITVDAGAALHVNNLLDSPSAIVTKSGEGTMDANRVRARKIKVIDGDLRMQDGGGTSSADEVVVSALSKLDLRNNSIVIRGDVGTFENGVYTGVLGMVAKGRGADGFWNETGGLTTSMPDATTNFLTTLGVALSEETPFGEEGSIGGVSVAADDVIVRYTWHGDADLNGELNGDDYFYLDSNILQSGSVFGFHNGDFNYDGVLNGDDYFLLDSTILYAQSHGGPPGLMAIPEPGVGALVFGLLALVRRQRW